MSKFVVSSYEVSNSLSLIEIDFKRKKYTFLKTLDLISPSFVISSKKYIFTFSKNPLKLLAYDYELNLLDEIGINLLSSTHLCFNDKDNTLYGASYLDGAIYSVSFNGKFSNIKIKKINNSKCHCVTLIKDNMAMCTDINNDALYLFDSNLNYLKTIELEDGCGARHSIVKGDKIFTTAEYSNELYMIDYNGQIISKCKTTNLNSSCATLFELNSNIYVSNRLIDDDSLVSVFSYTDKLKLISEYSTYGRNSRHMIKTFDEKYIISCNLDSNTVTVIDITNNELVLYVPFLKVSSICELK